MDNVTCTRLIEDRYGRLDGYRLLYADGTYENINNKYLAERVEKNETLVDNLTYNKTYRNFSFKSYFNRLEYLGMVTDDINKKYKFHKYNDTKNKIINMQDWINKARVLGADLCEIVIHDKIVAYYAKLSDEVHQIYIPDSVRYIHDPILRFIPRYSVSGCLKSLKQDLSVWDNFAMILLQSKGTVQFLGGISLVDVHDLFGIYNPELSLDLTRLNLNNVVDFYGMFNAATLYSVTFGTIKLNQYAYMNDMFNCAKIREIHMENVYTDNVFLYENMFRGCKSKLVDISNFDTSRAFGYRRDALENMFLDSEIVNLKTNCEYILKTYKYRN